MPSSENLTVTVPAELAAALRDAVATGEYPDLDAALADALAGWSRRHEDREENLAWLKASILRARLDPAPDLSEEEFEARMQTFYTAAERAADNEAA